MNSLQKLVEKFIDYDCPVKLGKSFVYEPLDDEGEGIIGITVDEEPIANIEWKEFLKKEFNFDLTCENVFAISVLHELGHHYTISKFDTDIWNELAEELTIAEIEDDHERHQAYFRLQIEYVATAWAVEFYRMNEETMRTWNHRLNCAIRHYLKKHPAKNSILAKI